MMRALRTLAVCLAAGILVGVVSPAAAGVHVLLLQTPGLGALTPGTGLEAGAQYTLGGNGPCPLSFAGSLASNGQAEDVARLGLSPPAPCGAGQTQAGGSPWTFKLGARRTLSVTGPKTLVIERAEPVRCVYEARSALGRLRTLKPLSASAEATLHPNEKLSSPRCARSQHLVFELAQVLARNEGSGTREAVTGEIR